jgi:ribose 1,5-bisphosphokinase
MLVLVVGPSGAGKDTLLALARQSLANDPRFRFVRRIITRPTDPAGEDHEPVSEAEFTRRDFALSWQAHGLSYGIPADIAEDLAIGRIVIANVSRGIIEQAASRFPTRVIEITAPPAILSQRLANRGRETNADIDSRLARTMPLPTGVPAEAISNDTTPDQAAAMLVASLQRIANA